LHGKGGAIGGKGHRHGDGLRVLGVVGAGNEGSNHHKWKNDDHGQQVVQGHSKQVEEKDAAPGSLAERSTALEGGQGA
jgi:hypothetical protein